NSIVQSETRLVAVIGMQDAVVIDTPDALLVTRRGQSQDVKQLVDRLKAEQRKEVASHVTQDMPWGRIESVAVDASHDMRIMTVQRRASLQVNGTGLGPSLLTVMSGEGRCLIDGAEVTMRRGQSVAIDPDHALPVTNISDRELKLIHMVFRGASDVGILRREVLTATPKLEATFRSVEAI
ncbi:MAG: hypothetical protein EON48_19505, partial [Acetobacteraceae bacterium]